ncbi:hypothetical protein LCGC14_1372300 [marine sediment metagenome]|uniref:Uncharacterized protein n=1 Tax=marine sediment metagenome TaxID=412755 RepID=A0A0F9K535_9ZZZZ
MDFQRLAPVFAEGRAAAVSLSKAAREMFRKSTKQYMESLASMPTKMVAAIMGISKKKARKHKKRAEIWLHRYRKEGRR